MKRYAFIKLGECLNFDPNNGCGRIPRRSSAQSTGSKRLFRGPRRDQFENVKMRPLARNERLGNTRCVSMFP